jgi:quinol-cytochrome oxidoreductase complex cytochrome b subunit
LSPGYWLGSLAFVAFLVCGVTGILQLQHYVPTPDGAYDSVQYFGANVPYGNLIQSIHLYSAYSMIIFAFAHMMRGYFLSVQKKPRELMWIVGMLMGVSAMAMGFTGYLLPWTVVSKSATDISIGLVNNMPDPIRSLLLYSLTGAGTDSDLILRFFALHTVIIPALLFLLFAVKLHIFEVYGVTDSNGKAVGKNETPISWFPRVAVYMFLLSAVAGAVVLTAAALFPATLSGRFSYEAASQATPTPEWYFLWAYQVLKLQVFEGQTGVRLALTLLGMIGALFFFLPFIDRGSTRTPRERPVYVTLGAIAIVELFVFTIWASLTPGETISSNQAVLVIGGSALITASIISYTYSKLRKPAPLLYERFPAVEVKRGRGEGSR